MLSTLRDDPLLFLGSLIAIFVAITVHEFLHAYTADRLGDPTPSLQKRVTLNPLAHIDLWGLVALFTVGFGWGKPVQFDPYNLKHPRKDAAIISLAGPLSNFVIALVSALFLRLLLISPEAVEVGRVLFVPLITINLILGLFNLIPVHPLDGFKIVGGLLSPHYAKQWHKLERYGYILLIILIFPFFGESLLSSIIGPVLKLFARILIPS